MSAKVLVVDDERAMTDLLGLELRRAGYTPKIARSSDEALALIEREPIDVVVTDLRMPGGSGTDLCQAIVQLRPTLPVIVMTGFGSMEAAIAAIRAGAYDFMTKPFPFEKLQVAIERALEHAALRSELHRLRRAGRDTPGLDALIGASPAMERVFALIERIAATEASVLLTGESGTGKELAARALHRLSRRSAGPYVTLNCAAIPENLFESELFGHVRGAYSGADRDRVGLLRKAHGGTLFLDEIGELPCALQPKLLRVLQEGRVRPVGSDTETPIDVRMVVATNRDLAQEVAAGRFRPDLFYRLAVITIPLPPLRERGDDIVLLAEHFVDELSDAAGRPRPELSDAAIAALLANPWPGNVRELHNWIEYAVAMTDGAVIEPKHLPAAPVLAELAAPKRGPATTTTADDPEAAFETLESVEREHILRVLKAVDNNKSRAARILGIDRKTLLSRLHRYDAN
ncbi:MAG: sigma-54-dependent Fis family transcriptional regulator [Myxococcales bacterium]|nr:sigma-54-dependent Fis family transcriptional regulator [Myxococcales bacterium]